MRNVVMGILLAATVASAASAETIRFATLNVFWLYDDARRTRNGRNEERLRTGSRRSDWLRVLSPRSTPT